MNRINEQLNAFAGFLKFKKTWPFLKLIRSPYTITAMFTGNQYGKTAGTAYQYVLRVLGLHPVPERNVLYYECENRIKCKNGEMSEDEFLSLHPVEGNYCPKFLEAMTFEAAFGPYNVPDKCKCGADIIEHQRETRVFRFASETLPGQAANVNKDGMSAEVRNTQYPALKKWLPGFLIKKDITFRNPSMIVHDPFGRGDIIIEFVSYSQSVQAGAGVQRLSCWSDEESPKDFHDEQLPRLLAENGDMIITLTPANYISWTYDEIYERAAIYHRTQHIVDFLKKQDKVEKLRIEKTASDASICVIQAATDDNPTLKKDAIVRLLGDISDSDVLAIRRYGIFKQVSGRIFKDFEQRIHAIKPFDIPGGWNHFRGIDYHPQTPWAFAVMSISPTNEAFIWMEENPSPEKFTTKEIMRNIALKCEDYDFRLSLVDPLAVQVKKDKISILDDMNRETSSLKRDGIGTGGLWQTWDTRGEHGRDEIKSRLKNSLKVGKPFNNAVILEGRKVYLPTLWIMNNCGAMVKSMKSWRWEEWADSRSIQIKEQKNTPQQKWSHFNMVIEALFKHPACRAPRDVRIENRPPLNYFQGRK